MTQGSLEKRVLEKALDLSGGYHALARRLRISQLDLAAFLNGSDRPTRTVFLEAVDVIIELGSASFLDDLAIDLPTRPALPAKDEGRRILVVEDNLDSVHSLTVLLQDMGHRVEYAINGYAALTIARRLRPEIVFLDIGLPGLDGFQVCKAMKEDPDLRAARVFAITAFSQDEHRRRALEAGIELHLVKPVSPKFLMSLLGSA